MYQPTDIVLAKVKGFPAWPAMIIPTELIPSNVLKGKQELEEETDDESKYIQHSSILKFRRFDKVKTQYCVKFFWDDSYIWLKPNDMKPLTVEDCESWLNSNKKKSKKLAQAFEMAAKGSQGIDVWEFVEYGSGGKPDEEYVAEDEEPQEEEEEEEEEDRVENAPSDGSEDYEEGDEKPTRTSQRQRQRQRQRRGKGNTRSTRSKTSKSEEPQELPPEEEPKPKKRKYAKRAPEPKFNFEEDEDMYLVGLGPQDLSIQENVSPLVNKLSNRKNLERHTEVKLDIADRLVSINQLFLDVLVPEAGPTKDGYQLILDELELAVSTKGPNDEFLTVFHMNNELLLNFRVLFNLKTDELRKLELWDSFQSVFNSIYEHPFEPDQESWTNSTEVIPPENDDVETEV